MTMLYVDLDHKCSSTKDYTGVLIHISLNSVVFCSVRYISVMVSLAGGGIINHPCQIRGCWPFPRKVHPGRRCGRLDHDRSTAAARGCKDHVQAITSKSVHLYEKLIDKPGHRRNTTFIEPN